MSDQHDDVYAGLMGEIARGIRTEAQTRYEISTLSNLLDLPKGARVLDVPCGAGRISIGLAGAGFEVTGADLSKNLLAMAREDTAKNGASVTYVEADMRDLPFDAEFDGALCFWESFGYFDDEGNLAFLRSVAKALKPGARFIMDTEVAESLFPKLAHQSPRYWGQLNGITMLEENFYRIKTGIWERNWTVMRGDFSEQRQVTIRIYTLRELSALLHEAGFATFDAHEFLGPKPFKLGGGRLLLVATKG